MVFMPKIQENNTFASKLMMDVPSARLDKVCLFGQTKYTKFGSVRDPSTGPNGNFTNLRVYEFDQMIFYFDKKAYL